MIVLQPLILGIMGAECRVQFFKLSSPFDNGPLDFLCIYESLPADCPQPPTALRQLPVASGVHRRTVEAIFHHPTAHNRKWTDVVALVEEIGMIHSQPNDKFVFEVAGKRPPFQKPYSKELTSSEVKDVRHFLIPISL